MHPQIRRDKPGNCPICGMRLTPLVKTGSESLHPAMPDTSVTSPDSHSAVGQSPQKIELMSAQNSVGNIQTEVVANGVLDRSLQLFGEIKYIFDNHLDLTSFYPGRVERVLIPYNTTEVSAGTPLLDLYSEEAIADQEKYLQALRDRYLTTFYERKIVTAQIEASRSRLLKAGFTEEDLARLVNKGEVKQTIQVKAMHGGSIVGVIPHTGERMSLEQVLFHITPLEKVWFAARVFEQDVASLKIGQQVTITSKANPGKTYQGRLVFIDRIFDPMTRTLLVRFEIDNPHRELLPEMSASGQVVLTSHEPALLVPDSALIDTGKRQLVYVQTASATYEQREVTVGIRGQLEGKPQQTFVEILSGLAAGERVVSSGAFLVDSEAQLRGK